jgi:type VI secretion system protein ImpL
VRNLGPAELNAKGKGFCTQLRDLTGKFPFTPAASQQASLQEFNAMFQPMQGAIATFYDLNLKSVLVRQGAQFVPSPNAAGQVNAAFLAFWNRITALSDAVYPNNSPEPRLAFSIKLQQVDAIENLTLNIDDQSVKASDRTSKPFVWTPAPQSEVKLTGRFGSGPELAFANYEGPWALFQFFGDADRWTTQGSIHTLEWVLRQGKAGRPLTLADGSPVTLRFEVDLSKAPPLFQKGYLSTIGCVTDIAKS